MLVALSCATTRQVYPVSYPDTRSTLDAIDCALRQTYPAETVDEVMKTEIFVVRADAIPNGCQFFAVTSGQPPYIAVRDSFPDAWHSCILYDIVAHALPWRLGDRSQNRNQAQHWKEEANRIRAVAGECRKAALP